jgi:hypothetical protein
MRDFSIVIICFLEILAVIWFFEIIQAKNVELYSQSKMINELANKNIELQKIHDQDRYCIKWDNTKDFGTMKELRTFLEEDATNNIQFDEKTFDCDDFALKLQNNAYQKGYRMSLQIIYLDDVPHMMNTVIVLEPRPEIVFIEPQNDKVEEFAYLD